MPRDENYERVMEMMEHGPLVVGDIQVSGDPNATVGFWRDAITGTITSGCGCRWQQDTARHAVGPCGSPTSLCGRHRAEG